MYIKLIQESVAKNTLLFLKYSNGIGVTSEREIEPRALFFEQNEWKFIAYCRSRKEFRQFLVNRIQSLKPLSQEFPPHQFTLESYFKTL